MSKNLPMGRLKEREYEKYKRRIADHRPFTGYLGRLFRNKKCYLHFVIKCREAIAAAIKSADEKMDGDRHI